MTRILVTGASGFLGRHAVEALSGQGHSIHVLTRLARLPESTTWAGIELYRGDLWDGEFIASVLRKVRATVLMHLAWTTTPGAYWNDSANEAWVSMSRRLFAEFAAAGGGRIVVAGSSAEYAWNSSTPLDEAVTPLQPISVYGRAKNELRAYLEEWAPHAGLSWAWGRVFNIFGPHEQRQRLVPRVILSLLTGRAVPFDSGSAVRDFLPVADAADALALLCNSPVSGAFNIASGEGVMVRELLAAIARNLDRERLLRFGQVPDAKDAPSHVVGSIRLLRQCTGWSPATGWRLGIEQTVRWWQDGEQKRQNRQKPPGP